MKTSNQETSNPKIGLEKIIEILGEANPIDLDWEIFHRERAIKNYFDALPAENLTQKANQIIEEIRKIEDGIIKYIINDLTARTEQTIKEYKEKEQQILEEGLTQVKQTFTVQEIIAISQKSKNTIYNHLKKDKLKGIQDDLGNWIVKREDLEKYLHRSDF